VLYLVPLRAEAMEVDFGASVGGMMAGGLPRFALSPYGAVSWPQGDHFVFVIHDMLSLLLTAGNHGPGGYDHLTVAGGVAWGDGKIIVGPSLSIFSMPACGPQWCARVGGFGAGANARADLFFWGPVGLSLSGNVDVPIQSNSVLPGGPVVTGLLGAVYRIR
jgi:hypothetical protein